MKTQHILIAIIVYLLFFRKVAAVPSVNTKLMTSTDYLLLQRDFTERIAVLEDRLDNLGPLA